MFIFYHFIILFSNIILLHPCLPFLVALYMEMLPSRPIAPADLRRPSALRQPLPRHLGSTSQHQFGLELYFQEARSHRAGFWLLAGLCNFHPISLEMLHVMYSRIRLLVHSYPEIDWGICMLLHLYPTNPPSAGGMNVSWLLHWIVLYFHYWLPSFS